MLRPVRRALPDRGTSLAGGIAVHETSRTVAEGSCRTLKQRTRRLGPFLAAGLVFANCDPYQLPKERKRHYLYPGLAPLTIAPADLAHLTWLDLLQI